MTGLEILTLFALMVMILLARWVAFVLARSFQGRLPKGEFIFRELPPPEQKT